MFACFVLLHYLTDATSGLYSVRPICCYSTRAMAEFTFDNDEDEKDEEQSKEARSTDPTQTLICIPASMHDEHLLLSCSMWT